MIDVAWLGVALDPMIQDWQSEPNFQQQNFSELGYRHIKKLLNVILDLSGTKDDEWLHLPICVPHLEPHERLRMQNWFPFMCKTERVCVERFSQRNLKIGEQTNKPEIIKLNLQRTTRQ